MDRLLTDTKISKISKEKAKTMDYKLQIKKNNQFFGLFKKPNQNLFGYFEFAKFGDLPGKGFGTIKLKKEKNPITVNGHFSPKRQFLREMISYDERYLGFTQNNMKNGFGISNKKGKSGDSKQIVSKFEDDKVSEFALVAGKNNWILSSIENDDIKGITSKSTYTGIGSMKK